MLIFIPYGGSTIAKSKYLFALYKWILTRYAKEGDIILDTHVGSASSLIAAYDAGLQYVGFELDKDYYNKSKKRLEIHKSQLSIFDLGVERR